MDICSQSHIVERFRLVMTGILPRRVVHSLGIDFGGTTQACVPIIEKRPCIYQFSHFPPPNLGFPPIFLTSLRQWSTAPSRNVTVQWSANSRLANYLQCCSSEMFPLSLRAMETVLPLGRWRSRS